MGRKVRRSLSTSSSRTQISTLTVTTPDEKRLQVTVSGNQSIQEAMIKAIGPEASQMLVLQDDDDQGVPLDGTTSVSMLKRNSKLRLIPQKPPATVSCLKNFVEEERVYSMILNSGIKLYGKPLLASKTITELEYKALFYYIHYVSEASNSFCLRLEKYLEAGLLKDDNPQDEDQVDSAPDNNTRMSILEELVNEGVLNEKDIQHSDNSDAISDKLENLVTNNKSNSVFYENIEHAASELDVPFRVQWKFIEEKCEEISDPDYDTVKVIQRSFSDVGLYNSSGDEIYESLNGHLDATPYESIEDLYNSINKEEGSVEERKDDKIDEKKEEKGEAEVLLEQLIGGELLDCYTDMLSAWPKTSALLWSLENKHGVQLRILKGPALYSLREYLTMPMERLSQYERLVQSSGSSSVRRRGQKLSDLERVQGLFPNDYLALHHHDVLQATATTIKSKVIRKRPSLDQVISSPKVAQHDIRQFVMEAPCQMSLVTNVTNGDSPQERHLFLFTDLLLIAKSRGNNTFKLKEAVRLCEVWASSDESDTSFLLGWAGQSSPVTYSVTYPTQAARDSWLRKIQNTMASQLLSEPKSTNIQIYFKDACSSTEFSKIMAVAPEMTVNMVIRQGLQLIFGAVLSENDQCLKDFCLWVKGNRDSIPIPLIGCERPHAIQMSKLRQILSNEDGFDMNHVNSKNNPCEIIFELRKLNRQPSRVKTPLKLFRRSSGKLFGVALVRLCPTGALPPVVLTMLKIVYRRGPHTQGIFRKSANIKALKHLREKIDNIGANIARFPELDNSPVLLVASLLKDFLRSLPQPVMLDSLYSSWMAVLNMGPAEKITSIRNLLLKLPKAHYNLLSHFIALLSAIARKSSINLMCPMNLAVCVGPSLLWPTQHSDTTPKAVPPLIEQLIIHADLLFGSQILNIFNKPNLIPSASLSLDSGAEESDSLNSVGLSLDSLDLNCNRKEKLSLSRDSGLTMSEDDSQSNGGNSPAPRFGQNHLVLPHLQVHQAQRIYTTKCYDSELQNAGLPKINMHSYLSPSNLNTKPNNVNGFYNDNIYGNKLDVQRTIEMQQKIYNTITEQNKLIHKPNKPQEIYGTNAVGSKLINNKPSRNNDPSPSKYLTGLEPAKPPRLGVSKMQRNTKGQSLYMDNNISPHRLYHRAKSSDDLLERGVENLYSNLNIKRQNRPENIYGVNANSNNNFPQTYCRVYQGWEHRVANVKNSVNQQPQNKFATPPTVSPPDKSAKNFTRKDWSRQASRTKSLETFSLDNPNNVPTPENKPTIPESPVYESAVNCNLRMVDPSHFCTRQCVLSNQNYYETPPTGSTKPIKINRRSDLDNKGDFKARLVHSKSLANIVLHSNSNSSDTLYQSPNYFSNDSPISSEHSSSNNYNVEYADNIYYQNRNKYSEKPSNIYNTEVSGMQDKVFSSKYGKQQGPPVPPRKGSHHKLSNLDEKTVFFPESKNQLNMSRKKSTDEMKCSYVPNYLQNNSKNFVLDLEDSASETESESYV